MYFFYLSIDRINLVSFCFVSLSFSVRQCSNDSVLSANFHPMDSNLILTCGKSHLNFWTVEDSTLTKRQGLFDVSILPPSLPHSTRLPQCWRNPSSPVHIQAFFYSRLFHIFLFSLFQKHEKPKYVLCIAFAENGDAITGDSSGNMCIWGKGLCVHWEMRG